MRVRGGRYVLRADRLAIEPDDLAGEEAWSVEGPAEAATCPADDPPVAWRFDRATLAPSGEAVLDNPTLLAFGVPVLWLPALWIRAPDRPGLLPPFVAYRGEEGLLVGAGAFVPLPQLDRGRLEARAGAFSSGGVHLAGTLGTDHSRTEITWERTTGDRVSIETWGGVEAAIDPPAAVDWTADLLRGDRAIAGTAALETAARPFDQGLVDVAMRPGGDLRLDAFVEAVADRGAGAFAIGPGATAAHRGVFGSSGRWDMSAGGRSLARSNDVVPSGEVDLRLSQAPLARPVELDLDARVRVLALGSSEGRTSRAATWVTTGALVRLPFARRFGSGPSAWIHTVTPVVDVRAVVVGRPDPPEETPTGGRGGDTGIGAVGVDSWLARWPGSGFRVQVRGGGLTRASRTDSLAAHTRWELDAHLWAASVEAAGVSDPSRATGRGGAVRGVARLGPVVGPSLSVDAIGRSGRSPADARLLADRERLPYEPNGYVDRRGLTGGAELRVPLGSALVAASRVDADPIAGDVVGGAGALTYAHPCGCIDIHAFGSRRWGREGFDAGLGVDLFPPGAAAGAP